MTRTFRESIHAASVSVVIPTYNSATFVLEAVRSVLAQSVLPREVIVVDDGSRDRTQEVLAPLAGRIVYIVQRNSGVATARNTGVARASGDYVCFLDADDYWHPAKLERQLDALTDSPIDFGAIGTGTFAWPSQRLPSISADTSPKVQQLPWSDLAVKNSLTTSSMLVKKTLLSKAGPFDSTLQGPEDHDMWLRLAELAPVGILGLPLTGYREVQGSLSKQAAEMERGMLRIIEKIGERGGWNGKPLLRRAAEGFVNSSCAYMYGHAGEPKLALERLVKSVLVYPIPFGEGRRNTKFARLKLFLWLCRTSLRRGQGVHQ